MPFSINSKDRCVTIVIPVYNREKLVGDAVESVVAQSSSNWRLIIVDDASTDGIRAAVYKFLIDRRISYIRKEKNEGVSRALNRGLELAKTPFFLQLDSDDWLEKDALEQLQKHAAAQSGDVALFSGNWWLWIKSKGKWRRRLRRSQPINHAYECTYKRVPRPRLYRTAALFQVGGWPTDDPFNGRYMEDRSMMIRLKEAGYNFQHIDHIIYNLRRHGGNQSKKENLPVYRRLKEWLYPQLIESWGPDRYAIQFKGNFALIRPRQSLL